MKTFQYSTLAVIILGLLIWTLDASTYQLRITPDSVRRVSREPAIEKKCEIVLDSSDFFDNTPTIKRCELEDAVCYMREDFRTLSCVKK